MKKRNILLNAAIILLLVTITSCGPVLTPTSTLTVALTPTNLHTSTPTLTLTQTPTPDPYATWSTNFASLTDLNGAEINEWSGNGQLSIDTTNVHSGGKSIKDFGTVNDQHFLQTVFKIHGLTGRDTVDLADKTLSIEMYVPSGSPLSYLGIELDSGDNSIFVRANIHPQKGRWYTYEADTKMDIALGSWQYYDWLHSPGISSTADAINLLNNVQIIKVNGTNDSSLNQGGDTYFLIDRLGWADAPDPFGGLTTDPNADSLRKYADTRNLKVGSVLLTYPEYFTDPSYPRTLAREFNLLLWNESAGWPTSQPADPTTNDFNYFSSDKAVAFAQANHMAVKSFAEGWYLRLPVWLMDTPFNQLQPILENRIAKDMSRYRGKFFLWDVFNEVVDDNGNGFRNRQKKNVGNPPADSFAPYGYHYSPWVDGDDTSLVQAAFRKARETDPSAKLFLNEFDNEQIGTRKSEVFYQFVKELRQEGVPIDGIGFQMHLWIQSNTIGTWQDRRTFDAYLDKVRQNVKRYSDLGVLVEFSEVEVAIRTDDIDFSTPAGKETYQKRLQDQAYVYAGLMKIAVENKNVVAFIFWTVSDPWSTTQTIDYPDHEEFGDPGLFDSFYQPKPAYYAVLNVLKGK